MGGSQCCRSCNKGYEVTIPAGPATVMPEKSHGPQPPTLPSQGYPATFAPLYRVVFFKKLETKLGIDVDYAPDDTVLPVISVNGGLAEQWNQNHPEAPVMPGDCIIDVNGLAGNAHGMMVRCETDEVLRMTMRRPGADAAAENETIGDVSRQYNFTQFQAPRADKPEMLMCCSNRSSPKCKLGC